LLTRNRPAAALIPRPELKPPVLIKEYTPGSILVLDTLAPNEPTIFKLSKSVVYVDVDGKTLEAPGLTTNQKVRVHYMKTAGENVADRVILIKD
jgi:hypothetical protein